MSVLISHTIKKPIQLIVAFTVIMLTVISFNTQASFLAEKKYVKVKMKYRPKTNKPKVPAREYMEATYYPSESVLVFDLSDFNQVSVTLTSPYTGHKWSFTVNPEAPEWYVTLSNGFYALTCTDQDGEVYQGTFLLE